MGLNALSEIVGIMAGIVAIMGGLWAIIRPPRPSSLLVNIITIFMIAIGVAATIYGGFNLDSFYENMNSEIQSCLLNKSCIDAVMIQYNEDVYPVLANIGLGLILIASGYFMRRLNTVP